MRAEGLASRHPKDKMDPPRLVSNAASDPLVEQRVTRRKTALSQPVPLVLDTNSTSTTKEKEGGRGISENDTHLNHGKRHR